MADDDKTVAILVTTWALTVLSLVFMALRFWAKVARAKTGLWWDDWILLVSWLCMYGTALTNTIMVTLGTGKHIYLVDPARLGDLTLLANVAGTTSILAAQLSKTSFGLTLLRIATDRFIRSAVWFAIISINIAMTANLLSQWFQCNPPAKYWNPILEGECLPPHVQSTVSIVMAAYSGGVDILLAVVPWKIVIGLQMKKAEKLGIASAMSMGVFAGAAACVKAAYIPGLASGDFTYASSELIIYSYVEIGLSIIAASIPALRVLVRDTIRSTRLGSKDGTMLSQTTHSTFIKRDTQMLNLSSGQIHRRDSVTVEFS